jgi:hypothetical protein
MAAGLHPIITRRAALPETAAGFASMAPFDQPDHPDWLPRGLDVLQFIETAIAAIGQSHKAQRDTQMAFARAEYDWAKHAKSWLDYLKAL